MSRIFAVLLLAAVYVLTLASLEPLDIAAGVVLGAAVVLVFRRALFVEGDPPLGAAALAGRLLRFPMFALVVVWEIIVGTWRVALAVVGVRPPREPGIVAVPIGERTATGVAATALAITLSPGELLVDIDEERRLMLIHVLDAEDPDALRERYEHLYQRWQKGVFP